MTTTVSSLKNAKPKRTPKVKETLPIYEYPSTIWIDAKQPNDVKIILNPDSPELSPQPRPARQRGGRAVTFTALPVAGAEVAKPAREYFKVDFNDSIQEAVIDSKSVVPLPYIDTNRLYSFANIGYGLQGVLTLHTALFKINANHPSKHGFVGKLLVQKGRKSNLLKHLISQSFTKQAIKSFSALLPKAWDNGYGWFPENIDPQNSKALYLAPHSEYADLCLGQPGRSYFALDTIKQKYYWGLFQVGFATPMEKVEWNDLAGIKALMKRAVEADPLDSGMIVRSLSDPDGTFEQIALNEKRAVMDLARKAFASPKDRVRVMGTVRRIEEIAGEFIFGNNIHKGTSYSGSLYAPIRCIAHTLDDKKLYASNRTLPSKLHAAVEIEIHPEANRANVFGFLQKLEASVKSENLGHLLINNETPMTIFLVGNVELFLEYKKIFCGSDKRVRTPTGSSWSQVSDGSKLITLAEFRTLNTRN